MALLRGKDWQPSAALLHEQLMLARKKRLALDFFPLGVDNAHIDVYLDPALVRSIESLVLLSLTKQVQYFQILQHPPTVDSDARLHFQETYSTLSIRVAQRARAASCREIYQLFVLAVVKKIYLVVEEQLAKYCQSLDHQGEGLSIQTSVAPNESASLFRQHQKQLHFLTSQEVLEQLHSVELQLRKQRKGILALSWPVLPEMLFNPLLHLIDLDHEETFFQLYPLLFIKPDRFRRFESSVLAVLSPYLPDCPQALGDEEVKLDLAALELRRDGGQLPGYAQVEAYLRLVMKAEEYQNNQRSWYDNPENLMWLFEPHSASRRSIPWGEKEWLGFQDRLLSSLEEKLYYTGLMDQIAASAVLPDTYISLGKKATLHLLFEYLCGKKKKDYPMMPIKYRDQTDKNAYQTRLDEAFMRIRQASSQQRRQWILQALEGYARLRRDLKLAWEMYRNMDLIRLLNTPEELALSQANNLLQDFTLQQDKREGAVLGHVILKADLRGSTQLIDRMLENGLNPAAYFSENLFDPINTLLRRYGAEKVFLEGDAVILMILDKEDHSGLVVARACGLANDIIKLVATRNRDNRVLGLPKLELGIGLSYLSEPPNYLFDEGRKITISPAINYADRLSSCSSRKFEGFSFLSRDSRVEVIVPSEEGGAYCGKDLMYRYNVNGIELDQPAFHHLVGELTLHKVKLSSFAAKNGEKERYYIGRFPDLQGKTKWLMVRRGTVKRWDGSQLMLIEDENRAYFYELVTDVKLTRKVRNRLKDKIAQEARSSIHNSVDRQF